MAGHRRSGSDAVLRTAMPGHDENENSQALAYAAGDGDGDEPLTISR
jgi:hypothetical protein